MNELEYESSVRERYASAAKASEAALCCPIEYPSELLEAIPDEVIERDYGCGDPSPYVRPGDTILDLGSGGGKLCFIAAQIAGPEGQVIGVDCNSEMLSLARRNQPQVAEKIGFNNVEFRCGMIQDLELDIELLAGELERSAASGVDAIIRQRLTEQRLRRDRPLIASDSVDCVVSNCVLNLVQPEDRQQLFREVFRVLKRGGRAAISDIVADEDVPAELRADPTLWSGCVSGAWREDEFLTEFERAGFHGMQIAKRQSEPWQTVKGIEFRSVTVVAYKGKQGPCIERNQALIYRGPFKRIEDDDGHVFPRGQRIAVCAKTFQLLQQAPYNDSFLPVPPYEEILSEQARPFDCRRSVRRHPRETKGLDYDVSTDAAAPCADGEACC